jgi:hypothetical protein
VQVFAVKYALFDVVDKESGQTVSVFGVHGSEIMGETVGCEFLVWTSNGWEWLPTESFEPIE